MSGTAGAGGSEHEPERSPDLSGAAVGNAVMMGEGALDPLLREMIYIAVLTSLL